MHSQLVSLWTSVVSMPGIIEKLERPTQKERARHLHMLLKQSWGLAFAFCNDNKDSTPHLMYQQTSIDVQKYAIQHKVTIEDAWTMIDPFPN